MNDEQLKEKQLDSEVIFDGNLLHIRRDRVQLPDGGTAEREYNIHYGSVCVIPVDGDGNVILERQYRYPIGQILLEIPAGKLGSADEAPLDAAKRELKEETGAVAEKWTDLGYFYPTPAYTTEKIWMYMAEGLSFGETSPDEDEFIEVVRMPLDELTEMICRGDIPDIKTQAAALRAERILNARKNRMKNPTVEMKIRDFGVLTVELYPDKAPETVRNFLKLVNEGFYDGLIFHRVISGFMIQGGGFDENFRDKKAQSVRGEFASNGFAQNDIQHDRGVISMARTSVPDSASSQFFIMHRKSPHLDGQYAAFGKVTDGIEVVDKIAAVKTGTRGWYSDVPKESVVIEYCKEI